MDSSSTLLVVKSPLSWAVEPSNVQTALGVSIKIDCKASGYPSPTITWFKLMKGSRKFVSHELYFDSVKLDTSGDYECVAENEDDSISKVINVLVMGKSIIIFLIISL